MRIGIQGGKGSFNEQALLKYLKREGIVSDIVYLYSTEKVLSMLELGEIEYGQFALYNTVAGLVQETKSCLGRYTFNIVAEYMLPVSFAYMKRKDVPVTDITHVASHRHVFAQCTSFLERELSGLSMYTDIDEDPAHIAERLSLGLIPKNIAVLGPISLATIYNLEVIQDHINDVSGSETLFLFVKRGLR